jgi:hypothetical protein
LYYIGTTDKLTCPAGKFIAIEGANSSADCNDCPSGRVCAHNSTLSEPCYAGYYCPFGQPDPIPCPIITYNDLEEATDIYWCKTCPSGYRCNETGIANYELYPCPVGFYCPNGTLDILPCPAGTYR